MKVKELIEKLRKMPQDFDVIYSIDEEGNAFHKIEFEPSKGHFHGKEFESDTSKNLYNAVCVN